MKVLDNIEKTVKGDLKKTIKQDSKISVAAACFSIYAYQELKSELSKVDEVNFIFTSPTFIKENVSKEQKEFYIPRLSREKSLYGTEFEVKLKNELTQKSIAKECVEWIRKKVTFKSNKTNEYMMGFMTVDESTYMPFNGFTTVDLGCERGNNVYYPVQKTESFENSRYYLNLFDTLWKDKNKFTDVTAEVIAGIEEAYKENSPEYLYFFTLYNIFSEFLEDISEDDLPNEATGFKESKVWNTLYNFQQDAALGIINKLEKYNGCILADSVGL
ncbi:MAG: ATP-dependent helicase, partial [Clostridium perfringens]|nr:ATP-dependent helicase [Clostridium perfringens]